jgi:ADP-glucose pyrophosphorylase
MDNVEVGEGSILENCIVSSGAKVGAHCVLKECLVGPKFVVPSEGKSLSVVFTNLAKYLCRSILLVYIHKKESAVICEFFFSLSGKFSNEFLSAVDEFFEP